LAVVEPEARNYASAVAAVAGTVLGSQLTGAYLHGSAVLGGFDVRRSDVDLLLVCDRRLAARDRTALVSALTNEALSCPATGLELSVVQRTVTAHPTPRPPFELHINAAQGAATVVDGKTALGDPDLVLHFAVCRAAGRPIGPSAAVEEVFGVVPRDLVLGQLLRELAWAGDEAPGEYAVLNACRAWLFADEGRLVSKVAGGEWALTRVDDGDAALIASALRRQHCQPSPMLTPAAVREFLDGVAAWIRARAEG
jgi:streptomycin 3"-adenylyltransferase